MATKILDQDKVLELFRRYRPGLALEKAAGGGNNIRFLCPFHSDTNPSFVFSPSKGTGYCYACKGGGSFDKIISLFEHSSEEAVADIIESCKRLVKHEPAKARVKNIDISLAQIEEWNKNLATHMTLGILVKKWGWTDDILNKYLLGESDNRLTIPMFEGENIVGLKYYSPGHRTMKYQSADGSVQCCWPLESMQHEEVYLVEGEKDCLTMLSAGFNAVTFTAGAGGIAKDYIRYFAGKTVYIIYDIDEIGRKGAVTVANVLSCATRKVFIVELPLEGIPKGDLTDAYMQDPPNFKEYIDFLVKNTTEYQPPAAVNRIDIPSEVVKTYLEDIVTNKLFYRRVNMKVRVVSNTQHETIVVPKDVLLNCNRDYKDALCQQCPLYYKKEGISLHVKPHYPEIMSMVGNNLKVVRAAIQSMTDVVEGCPKFKIDHKAHQALYPIVIIPAIEADKKHHSYKMFEAWALNIPSQENEDYDAEGVVLANPETQHLELIIYRMDKDEESIDAFKLTDQMVKDLEVFQCTPHPSIALHPS